jgi:hypothetical protein
MNKLSLCAALCVAASLAGCLEVEQHPAYVNGAYAGKVDNRAADVTFKGDNAAWKKAIDTRTGGQNEYNRVHP